MDTKPPRVLPSWFLRTAWRVHRMLVRTTRGRFLWDPTNKRGWGALRLVTTGRRTGAERAVVLGYLEDSGNLVLVAMNGGREGQPAWWLNLQTTPAARVELAGGRRLRVVARGARPQEQARLWNRWTSVEPTLQAYARHRRTPTPLVVLEAVD